MDPVTVNQTNTNRWVATIAGIVLALITVFASPVAAQSVGSLELVAQSAWVDDGGIYDIQVRVAGADPDSSVVLRIYPPWPERDDFLRKELAADLEPILELEPIMLGDVQGTSNEVLGFEVAVAGPNIPIEEEDEANPISILRTNGGSAVYPVEVSLYNADGELSDQFLTSLIELPRGQRNAPLRTAIVLEATMPPMATPIGTAPLDEGATAQLATIVDAIAQHPDADVALSISPEALVGLESINTDETARILDQLRTNITASQLLPNPYSEVEEQAWIDAGLEDELAELYQAGSVATNAVIGIEPEPSAMLLDRTVDDEGLQALISPSSGDNSFGVQGVIVRPAQLSPLNSELFPQALTTRFVIPTADGRTVPALVADGGLSNHFTNPGGAAYNANRLLADLTLLSLQNAEVRQAVVVNPPADWIPDATFLNVMLTGIERIPAIRGASPFDALSDTAFTPSQGLGTLGSPLRRDIRAQRPAQDLLSFRTEYSQAQAAIASWSTVIAADQASLGRLQELLRVSTDYRLTDGQRNEYIDAIYDVINTQKDASITTPESETITLTGRISEVPIVVENNLGVDAAVLLVLDSEKLAFPDGQAIEIVLEPGPNRIDIPIEALASGDSPIRIQVFSPDRSVTLGSAEILVRTFAFSGVGLVIGVVAIIVLLLWWLQHLRSTRDTVKPLPDTPPSVGSTADTEEPIGV